ncbi:hypothetical protein [Yersinia rohdei]|uniref:hypothetical protein n=1 Tax=Yersinia rohdei TaxID=29485 RepID=UPI0005DD6159|nr:hypothetical protein [Yersinia rohdei]MDN0095706.1 hypothetical protein [Yersinia rohdei]CNJ16087.1 Uncharacterised protein [Yersinia rohdei]
MLIKCISNSMSSLPLSLRCLGETDNTDFTFLKVGHMYVVYGLMFFPCRVDYLISPEDNDPVWVPGDFFEIIDKKLHSDWSINITHLDENYKILYENFNIQVLIGYVDLVTSISHYIGILEREPSDLRKFYEEKNKIDEWQLAR